MRKLTMATILLTLMAGPAAIAQTGSGVSSSSSGKQTPWPAPVGHRQPRLDQVPSEKNINSTESREDADLDRKIKSICRGC